MILVFGSINIDLSVPVPRLPAAGETVLGGDYALWPGGKGANQALAARRAGADVIMAGAVGNDAFAELAVAGLRREGVDLSLVRPVAQPTGAAAIMVDPSGDNVIAVAPGANRDAAADSIPAAVLGPRTVVVCQMEVPAEENWRLIRRAAAAGARIVLNLAPAAPVDREIVAAIDILVANEGEAAALTAEQPSVRERLRGALIVTRGGDGATALLPNGGRLEIPSLPIDPIDTTGAGDTFVGVLAAALDAGLGLEAALRRASAAAALACLAAGAQSAMPDAAAIAAALVRLPPQTPISAARAAP